MAARVYIVLARNDVSDNLLQVLDLKPNSSQRVPALEGEGQTGYLTWDPQNDTVATTGGAGGIRTTNAIYKGLAAYVIDNVENVQGGNLASTAAQANTIAAAILTRITNGTSLTLAAINTIINAAFGGAANSDLNGAVAGSFSTGTVEEVLRIAGGEVYSLPAASQVGNAGNAFPGHGVAHVRKGAYLASTATGYRNVRQFVWTGELNLSCLSGTLSKLKAATWQWINPLFTYGAAGTALTASGTHILATGLAAAVVVYEADGDVL
jgi:hypothetical protein